MPMRWSFCRTARTSRPRRPRLRRPGMVVVGDVLELAEHEARHDQQPGQEARGHDVDDATVDDGAGVEVGDGDRSLARRVGGRGRVTAEAQRLQSLAQVVPLGDRQAHHAERQSTMETPMGSSSPAGAGRFVSGRPSRKPMSRPMSRPAIGGHELVGGHVRDGAQDPARRDDREVGGDGEADHAPGSDPGQRAAGGPRALSSSRTEEVASKPDQGDGQDDPQRAAEQADEPQHGTGTLPEARFADRLPRGTARRARACSRASRSVATGTSSRPEGTPRASDRARSV